MNSIVRRLIHCPVCGKETEIRVLRGTFQTTLPDLDGDPHDPILLETVQQCAHCGYAADSLEETPPQNISALMSGEAYQTVLRDPSLDAAGKKLQLAALADDFAGDNERAAHHRMMAVWHLRAQQADGALIARLQHEAIERMTAYLEENADPEAACVLIDCLRQTGDFAGAEETAESLAPYVAGTPLEAVAAFERSLIAAGDRAPHNLSEVRK